MGAAKVKFKTQDRSAIVQGLSGTFTAIVVRSKKGEINEPRLVTSEEDYIKHFGKPDLRYPDTQSAVQLSKITNKLWVVRAGAKDAKYGAVLVRGGDFLPNPDNYSSEVKKIIEPIEKGLTKKDLSSYIFEQKMKKIQIEKLLDKPGSSVIDSYTFVLGGEPKEIEAGQKIIVDKSDSLAPLTDYDVDEKGWNVYDVLAVKKGEHKYQRIIFDVDSDGNQTTLTVKKGTVVKNKSNGAKTVCLQDGDESPYIIVASADEFHDGDEIVVLDADGNETDDKATQKLKDEIDLYFVTVKQPITLDSDMSIYKLTKVSLWDTLYSFMVHGLNEGEWNNGIEVGIEKNKDYPDMKCFDLVIWDEGYEVERFLVSLDDKFVDGFNKKRFVETVVNGNSNYIGIKVNPFAKNLKGEPINPKPTDYSIWKREKEMLFGVVKDGDGNPVKVKEDVFAGDIELFLSDVDGIDIGDKLALVPWYDESDELEFGSKFNIYTVENKVKDNKQIFLSKQLNEDYEYDDENDRGYVVYKFQKSLTDKDKHIIDGYKYFPWIYLPYPLYGKHIGEKMELSGNIGKVLDAGFNFENGGDDGSVITLADMIFALRSLSNNTKTPVQMLCDGGITVPAYAQEMLRVAMAQGENNTHCYFSMDPAAEESANPLKDCMAYADKLMINSHLGSLFEGWVKQYDPYNLEYVWVAPSVYGIATQNYVHNNYTLFTPAAGLVRGKVLGLSIKHQFSEGELDLIVDARINPIINEPGQGLIVWGNRTLYAKPSPLQLRSVAFLLMVIRYGLESYLKYELFNYNNPTTWNRIKSAIDSFMSNDIKAKEGVYDFKCIVAPSNSDIDNRRLPIFLGIQPMMDINEIEVTLAIFNRSLAIKA